MYFLFAIVVRILCPKSTLYVLINCLANCTGTPLPTKCNSAATGIMSISCIIAFIADLISTLVPRIRSIAAIFTLIFEVAFIVWLLVTAVVCYQLIKYIKLKIALQRESPDFSRLNYMLCTVVLDFLLQTRTDLLNLFDLFLLCAMLLQIYSRGSVTVNYYHRHLQGPWLQALLITLARYIYSFKTTGIIQCIFYYFCITISYDHI